MQFKERPERNCEGCVHFEGTARPGYCHCYNESRDAAMISCDRFRPNLKQEKVDTLKAIAEQLFIMRGGKELLEPTCGECEHQNNDTQTCGHPNMQRCHARNATRACRQFAPIDKESHSCGECFHWNSEDDSCKNIMRIHVESKFYKGTAACSRFTSMLDR